MFVATPEILYCMPGYVRKINHNNFLLHDLLNQMHNLISCYDHNYNSLQNSYDLLVSLQLRFIVLDQ